MHSFGGGRDLRHRDVGAAKVARRDARERHIDELDAQPVLLADLLRDAVLETAGELLDRVAGPEPGAGRLVATLSTPFVPGEKPSEVITTATRRR